MTKLNSKSKILLALIIIDLLLTAVWLFLSVITWRQLVLNSAEISSGAKIDFSELKHFLNSSQDKINFVNAAVITTDNVDEVIDNILNLAAIAGVEVAIEKAQPTTDGLDLDISSNGNFRNSIQFLRLMEKLPYRLKINSENLVLQSESGGDLIKVKNSRSVGLWRTELELKILSYHK